MAGVEELKARLEAALPPDAVLHAPEDLKTYECDGLTGIRALPALVALPETTEQVQATVGACHDLGVPFVARGDRTAGYVGAVRVA
jgi:glycolate oxidase